MRHAAYSPARGRGPRLFPLLLLGGAVYALARLAPARPDGTNEGSPDRRGLRGQAPADAANRDLRENARKALALKQAAEADKPAHPVSRTAHEGMRPLPNRDIAPSGALEAEGFKPAFERGGRAR